MRKPGRTAIDESSRKIVERALDNGKTLAEAGRMGGVSIKTVAKIRDKRKNIVRE